MERKVRWGILGCADVAENRFIPGLVEHAANGEFYALASRGGARFERVVQKHKPAATYTSYEALLQDANVDAVYLPLPNPLKKGWVIKAARAKKHILCEKPIACNVGELQEMEAACRENGVLLMEAMAALHSPIFPAVKEVLASGEIGKVKLVFSRFHFPLEDMDSIVASYELKGGAISDVGCYNTTIIRQFSGREPLAVKAFAEFLPSGVDASCYAVFDMGDGITGISSCAVNTAFYRGFSILGEAGYLSFERTVNAWDELDVTVTTQAGTRTVKLNTISPYALEAIQFGACILDGEQPLVTLEESRANLRALDMLYEEIGLYQA